MARISRLRGVGSALLLLCGAPVFAGSVTRLANDQVDVKADRIPLGQLLRELAAVTPIPTLVIDPKIEQQVVSAYLEKASVEEAVRQTLEQSGIQFLLWGGGAQPLGLYVGDLKKASLGTPSSDLASMTREERKAVRDQLRTEHVEAVVDPVPEGALPADTFTPAAVATAVAASSGSGSAAPGEGMPGGPAPALGGSGSMEGGVPRDPAGTSAGASTGAPSAPLAGLPPPVRGVASWAGADGQTHTTGYTMQGDTLIYDDPNFVSFKNSPEARARRMNMDVSTLP
jgi:hypothetical protein